MENLLHAGYSLQGLAVAAIIILLAFSALNAIYAVFFHPLRKIPGPWWAAVTRVPYAFCLTRGSSVSFLQSLHDKHGHIVRYSPNEISVTKGDEAWQQIYGFRTGKQKGTQSFPKDIIWYPDGFEGERHIVVAPEGVHGRQRKILSHAFSERSLRDQEWLIHKYADLMISRIKETDVARGTASDLQQWYTWFTFDTIADLTFGEPFNCLARNSTHEHVNLMIDGFRVFGLSYCMHHWPTFQRLHRLLFGEPKSVKARAKWMDYLKEKVLGRIEANPQRHDFMTDILAKLADEESKGNDGITRNELIANANVFMGAGTDTTATVLQCVSYFVLRHPDIYSKVRDEVRSRFRSQDEITIEAANGLAYTIAVLTEAMRLMPPVPAGFPRKVPSEGAMVCGHYLPGNCNVSVSMTQFSSNHDESNFRDADKFVPERWLGDARYEKDNRATFSPFSFGPRNCLGKNLAYAEMRVVFAKMMFSFDMELSPGMDDWLERCEVFAVWMKPPLLVRMTPVES